MKKWLFSVVARNLKPATLKFSASVKNIISHTPDVMLQMATIKLWTVVLGTSRKKI